MFSAIVWSVWAILVGGIVYLAQKQMLKENPNDAKPIKHGSIAMVVCFRSLSTCGLHNEIKAP